jgi:hypothetical protein
MCKRFVVILGVSLVVQANHVVVNQVADLLGSHEQFPEDAVDYDVDYGMWLDEAEVLAQQGNPRGAATIIADLLEYDSGNQTLLQMLFATYDLLYAGDASAKYPAVPTDEAVSSRMATTVSVGTVLRDGRRVFADVLDPQPGPARLFVVRELITPAEVDVLRSYAQRKINASYAAEPIVCLVHEDFPKNKVFLAHTASNANHCLKSAASKKVLPLVANFSVSLSMWPSNTTRRPGGGGAGLEVHDAAVEALLADIEKRIERATALPPSHGHIVQLLSYGVGSSYLEHTDCTGAKGFEMTSSDRGFSTLMLLTDWSGPGGETAFPQLGLKV